jgi:16S rRNA (adenine(1408)-N(1))-methyltransferase
VDVGTGDGAFVCDAARKSPDTLYIGIDANADNLRDASRKAARKPSRGGLPNVILGRLPLEEAPGELLAIADSITVLFPWGSLLRAVALPQLDVVRRLSALARPNATIRVVFGCDPDLDGRAAWDFGPRPLTDSARLEALCKTLGEAALTVRASVRSASDIRALPTTWAKKLGHSGKQRTFVELLGTVGLPASK